MKEFWKSVNIWRSYWQEFSVLFLFETQCIIQQARTTQLHNSNCPSVHLSICLSVCPSTFKPVSRHMVADYIRSQPLIDCWLPPRLAIDDYDWVNYATAQSLTCLLGYERASAAPRCIACLVWMPQGAFTSSAANRQRFCFQLLVFRSRPVQLYDVIMYCFMGTL